jgi:para-nitrobenzyl esterase
MAMPSATGLFHGAIVQSGSTLTVGRSDVSQAYGLAFAKALGVTAENAQKLNDFTYDELVAASRRASEALSETGGAGRGGVGPTVDGKYIVQNPFDPAPAAFAKQIPMIIGSNLNEFGYQNRAIITPQSLEQVRTTLAERYGAENVEKYIQAYRQAYPNDQQPQHILTTSVRPNALKQAAVKSAQGGAPVYVYLFEWQSPVNDGSLGAAHGMELPFMFNNIALARPLTGGGADAYALADKISSAWISFVKTGNPNHAGLPEWPAYTAENGATLIFDNHVEVRKHHDKALVDLVSSLPPATRR